MAHTPQEHQHSAAVEEAARWLADEQEPPRPIVPVLRSRFGLSALEATEAAAMADSFRPHRRAQV
ncbi:hypothetical protein LXM94_01885 [Rhizobium sp. TRM95111]|nr:hypothetical protein [Rhizobium alarense]MCF3638721.1 hypothetical protein [Rhizobium alarense]